jgi:hypothetical protein
MSLTHLNKLLISLKVIGRIGENGRISSTGRTHISIESEGFLQSLWRTLSGESRERNFEAISSTVNGVIEISNQLMDSAYLSSEPSVVDEEVPPEFRKRNRDRILIALADVSQDMRAAIAGMSNLSVTYANDAVMFARLDQLIKDMNHHVEKVDQRLIRLKQEKPDSGPEPRLKPSRLLATRTNEY